MTRRIALIGARGSLDDLVAPSSACDSSSDSVSIHVKKHTLTPGESIKKKKFKLYTATPIVEMKDHDQKEKSRAFFTRKLNQLLVKKSLSILNHHRLKLVQEFDAEQLEEVLLDEVDAICAENDIPLTDPYSVAMGSADSKGVSDPERSIRLAAEYALEIWNPEVYRSIQQRAREAGRKNKKYTLADHLATAHLNVTAAASTLGLSRPTIYAMRREYVDLELDLETGKVNEDIASATKPDQVRSPARGKNRISHPVELADDETQPSAGRNQRANSVAEDREAWINTVELPY